MAKRTGSPSLTHTVMKKFAADVEEKCSSTIFVLNDDCLEAVFSYLSREELINLRHTNSKFRLACERAFNRNYGKIQTIVSNIHGYRVNMTVLKNSIKLLKTFGHCITKLVIEFKLEKISTLLEAIESHCGENIQELELRHIGIRVKFPSMVNQIGLEAMDQFLRKINDKFPNLNCIRYDYRNLKKSCPYLQSINRHIPSLTTLSLIGPAFPFDDFREIIQSNGQLTSFTIIGEPNASSMTDRSFALTPYFVELLDELLPQLKHLKMSRVSIDDMETLTLNPKRFKNLKSLEFDCFPVSRHWERGYLSFLGENVEDVTLLNFDADMATFAKNISTFKNLKRLVLRLNSSIETTGDITVFLSRPTVLVWSSLGIRTTISSNSQLQELVIERCRVSEHFFQKISYDEIEKEYLDCVDSAINGAQWNLKRVKTCYIFSKQVQN